MSEINTIKATGHAVTDAATHNVNKQNKQSAEANNAATEQVTTATDKVSLNTDLQALKQTISAAPDTNQQRINEIRTSIEAGTYQVDAAELAQSILSFEHALK